MPTQRPPHSKSPLPGAQRHAEHVPKALAGLAALTAAAYFEGMLYVRAYFAQFGAVWILDEVPMAIFFERSMTPLLLTVFLAFLAIMGLFDIETAEQALTSTRFKIAVAVTTYGPWTALALGIVDIILGELGLLTTAIVLSAVLLAMFLLLLASLFTLTLVSIRNANIRLNRTVLLLSVSIVVLCSYWVPTQIGSNYGKRDMHPALSTLPSLNLRGHSIEYKLLFSLGERLYVFPANYGGDAPPIETTSSSQVEFIRQGKISRSN
ncbi:MAG: hypothetical protein OEY86_04265 [Nitrospira sp.]|nr:hypothetical protein [Nitrospira sp.]